MIKDAVASCSPTAKAAILRGLACDRDFEAVIDRVMQLLFAPDVSLGCLDRSMTKQEPNLFEFAAAIVAQPSTGATKVMGRQVSDSGLAGAPLDSVPDYVGRHATFLSLALLRNSSEYSPFIYAGTLEPCVQQLL